MSNLTFSFRQFVEKVNFAILGRNVEVEFVQVYRLSYFPAIGKHRDVFFVELANFKGHTFFFGHHGVTCGAPILFTVALSDTYSFVNTLYFDKMIFIFIRFFFKHTAFDISFV